MSAVSNVERALSRELQTASGIRIQVKDLITALEDLGANVYVTGGTPRDAIQDLEPKDVDLSVNLPISTTRDGLARRFGPGNVLMLIEPFGLLKFGVKANEAVDVNIIRDSADINGAASLQSVVFMPRNDLHADAANRDLTINALYYNRSEGFLDPSGKAIRDIEARTINIVASPAKRLVDWRIAFRALLFTARGYQLSAAAGEYVSDRLEQDIHMLDGQLGGYLAELVGADRRALVDVIDLASMFLRQESTAFRALRNCIINNEIK